MKMAEPEIMAGVSKGVIHKNTGARKVSRLTKRLFEAREVENAAFESLYEISGTARFSK